VPIGLALTFALVSGDKLLYWTSSGLLGADLRIYRLAAVAGLGGGNPWGDIGRDFQFAGPPPSLLPYLPAAFLPEDTAVLLYALGMVAGAAAVVRALGLPIWWLLFPPLFESLLSLSADALVLACVANAPAIAGASVAFKIYGAIPLLVQRRWRALVVAGLIVLLSLPWWGHFLASRDAVANTLLTGTARLSAWGTWLMIPTVIALWVLRSRGAEWMIVPALWPATQLHYSTIALPAIARSPLMAFMLSFSVPLLPPLAVMAEAARVLVVNRFIVRKPLQPPRLKP
jgi:hypothetical protein